MASDADGKRPRVGPWGCTPPQHCAPNPNAAAASSCCSELPSILPRSVLPSASAAGVQAGVVLTTFELERLQAVKQRIDTELNGGLAAHPFHVRRRRQSAAFPGSAAAAFPRSAAIPGSAATAFPESAAVAAAFPESAAAGRHALSPRFPRPC